MQLQASKCYYHPERGAVTTCAKCGVGICKECSAKVDRGRILCYQCGNEYLKREHKEYRKWIKERGGRFREGRDFVFPGIIGVLIVIAYITIDYFHLLGSTSYIIGKWADTFFMAYILFSWPFSFIMLGELLYLKFNSELLNRIKFIIKFAISLLFGWIIFPFILIRFIIGKTNSTKSKT